MIDLNEFCKVMLANATQRQKNGGNVKTDTRSMLKHCATEVVEASEAYRLYEYDVCDPLATNSDEQNIELFASELADIICCVLIIAGKEEINIEQAITYCVEKNRKRAEGVGDKL
jgi:NTP pyrophosphatase (non-canonical NTP hydrolase)